MSRAAPLESLASKVSVFALTAAPIGKSPFIAKMVPPASCCDRLSDGSARIEPIADAERKIRNRAGDGEKPQRLPVKAFEQDGRSGRDRSREHGIVAADQCVLCAHLGDGVDDVEDAPAVAKEALQRCTFGMPHTRGDQAHTRRRAREMFCAFIPRAAVKPQ
jgi:hypothetical protein